MQVEVNGTQLWFDLDGAALTSNGSRLDEGPTLLLLHAGPGSYDHSYFGGRAGTRPAMTPV